MTEKLIEKMHLSAKGLLNKVKECFEKVKEPKKGKQGRDKQISTKDCLMSALAIFKLKYSSLLKFEDEMTEKTVLKDNLKNLFQIDEIPCDTYLRERLDELDPTNVRPVFKKIFSNLQRGKTLEKFVYLDGKYLLLSDGTGFFHQKKLIAKIVASKIIEMALKHIIIKC